MLLQVDRFIPGLDSLEADDLLHVVFLVLPCPSAGILFHPCLTSLPSEPELSDPNQHSPELGTLSDPSLLGLARFVWSQHLLSDPFVTWTR